MSKKTKPASDYPKMGGCYLVAHFPGVKRKKNRRKLMQVQVIGMDTTIHTVTADLHWKDCEALGWLNGTATIPWSHLKPLETDAAPNIRTFVPPEDFPVSEGSRIHLGEKKRID